ncbi:hypothetical protein AVEN_141602-1 [Araneus ventricosus]|uniref:RNase H type-1 domain-containing protein n=1 Tax=Araneus ventricosus TaxID=182803 RepID=A0A4Y2ILJ5_ARAVE|nr:hypothetical protein AVEN_141602-1 [Araneus ventricosus]
MKTIVTGLRISYIRLTRRQLRISIDSSTQADLVRHDVEIKSALSFKTRREGKGNHTDPAYPKGYKALSGTAQDPWSFYLIQIHPHILLPHNQISFAENHRDSGVKVIYTDESKTDEGICSAYCILENYGLIASWQGKLDHSNSLFQAEILAIKMAIEAASSLHRPIKIWTDSLSSLITIYNPKSHHSMVREIQILLLSHKHVHLRWLNAHVGYLGNDCTD